MIIARIPLLRSCRPQDDFGAAGQIDRLTAEPDSCGSRIFQGKTGAAANIPLQNGCRT
jgi:hypothetical protein